MGLLKYPKGHANAHLQCCAANRTARRISLYASRFALLRALHLNIFEQPQTSDSRNIIFDRRRIPVREREIKYNLPYREFCLHGEIPLELE
jgi:hypothetical protein